MNRRGVLTLIGGMSALAGCSSRDPDTDPTPIPTETPIPPPDGTALSRGLVFGNQVTGAFTSNGPAMLELHCTNRLEREITATATLGPPLPFSGRFGWNTAQDAHVLLYPDEEQDFWFQLDENDLAPVSEVLPQIPENGCWRVPTAYDGIAVPPGQVSREIAAEGSITHRYALYHMYKCVPGTDTIFQAIKLTATGFGTEEFVPLLLRVVIQGDGALDIESFGLQDGYPS